MQFHYKNLSAPNNSTLLLLRSFEPSSTPLGLFMMSPSAFRRLSLLPPFRSPTPSSAPASASEDEERHFSDDASSHHSTQLVINVEPPMPSFQVKRVDLYYSNWSKSWKYRNMSNKVAAEPPPSTHTSVTSNPPMNDQWKDYALVLVRLIPMDKLSKPSFRYIIKSTYVRAVCEDVIQSWPGIKWDAEPLEISPHVLITFYKHFCAYRDALDLKITGKRTANDSYLLTSASLIIEAVSRDFGETLREVDQLLARKEITCNLLHTLYIPGSLVVAQCADTKLPRIFRLTSVGKENSVLECESVGFVDDHPSSLDVNSERSKYRDDYKIGKVKTKIILREFEGTVKVTDLAAYPIMFHPNEAKLREQLRQCGKKWMNLIGVHHMQYDGPGIVRSANGPFTHNVKSRIMVDRKAFREFHSDPSSLRDAQPKEVQPTYGTTIANDVLITDNLSPNGSVKGSVKKPSLSDEDLLLTPTVVYGFSLSDKLWLEFNISLVTNVEWNDGTFKNLVLPAEKKSLLQAIVHAHHKGLGSDDFVKEKGQGLVLNLSGPPGVGKTFSAEATSEHVKRPLYVIGSGELGTSPDVLEQRLKRILDVATSWKAIVLIDEADVFLQKRSHSDLSRNAMVAVFLRQIEYYRGILFLTTNRLSAYDEAFLSRVHVAFHFPDLSEQSRQQIWAGLINQLEVGSVDDITTSQLEQLAKRKLNGRQIKNAVRTAQSLSMARDHKVRFVHFVEALNAIEEFTKVSCVERTKTMNVRPEDVTLMYSF